MMSQINIGLSQIFREAQWGTIVPNGAVWFCAHVCAEMPKRGGTVQGLALACAGGLGEPSSRPACWLAVALCFLAWVLVRIGKAVILTLKHHFF